MKRSSRTSRWRATVVAASTALLGTTALAGASAAANAPQPLAAASIRVSPAWTNPGTSVRVSGAHFGASETADVLLDGALTGTATTDGTGAFVLAAMTVPSTAAPGAHTVFAKGLTTGRSATTTLIVNTDWPQAGFGPAGTGYNPHENVLSATAVGARGLTAAWSTRLTWAAVFPVVVRNVTYTASSSDGVVEALRSDGSVLWSKPTGDSVAGIGVVAGTVYVTGGASTGRVAALRASDGALLWNVSFTSLVGPAVVVGSLLYVDTIGFTYALKASTGAIAWVFQSGDDTFNGLAVSGGKVYVGSSDVLYALNALTGALVWATPGFGQLPTAPAVVGGRLYVHSAATQELYAVNASTGAVVWMTAVGDVDYDDASSPVVAQGIVYVGGGDGHLSAFKVSSGGLLWSLSIGGFNAIVSTAGAANGVVYASSYYVPTGVFTTEAVDAATGHVLWSTTDGTAVAAVVNGTVYVVNGASVSALMLA